MFSHFFFFGRTYRPRGPCSREGIVGWGRGVSPLGFTVVRVGAEPDFRWVCGAQPTPELGASPVSVVVVVGAVGRSGIPTKTPLACSQFSGRLFSFARVPLQNFILKNLSDAVTPLLYHHINLFVRNDLEGLYTCTFNRTQFIQLWEIELIYPPESATVFSISALHAKAESQDFILGLAHIDFHSTLRLS